MRNLVRAIVLITFIFGCAYLPTEVQLVKHRSSYIEKAFKPHVEAFEKACNKKVDIPIRFMKNIPGNTIGFCFGIWMPNFVKFIYVDKQWWDTWHDHHLLGEELIMHELGHCILNELFHTNDVTHEDVDVGRPLSVMNHEIFGYWGWYQIYRDKYLKELCSK
jgi:hypothetical protein